MFVNYYEGNVNALILNLNDILDKQQFNQKNIQQ